MPPDIRGTRRDRLHDPTLASPTRVSTLRRHLAKKRNRSSRNRSLESERNETHAPSFLHAKPNRNEGLRGSVASFRPTVYPRAATRNVCSGKRWTRDAAHVPNAERQLSRAPRGRELYTSGRRASIGRALALARFSDSSLLSSTFDTLPAPSLSLSLSARFRASLPPRLRAAAGRESDRDQTDWINRKSSPPPDYR